MSRSAHNERRGLSLPGSSRFWPSVTAPAPRRNFDRTVWLILIFFTSHRYSSTSLRAMRSWWNGAKRPSEGFLQIGVHSGAADIDHLLFGQRHRRLCIRIESREIVLRQEVQQCLG